MVQDRMTMSELYLKCRRNILFKCFCFIYNDRELFFTYFKTQFKLKHKPNQIHNKKKNWRKKMENLYCEGLTCEL